MRKTKSWIVAKLVLGFFLIATVTIWTYHESINNQLVWDSYHYLVKYVWYISQISLDNIIWMFLSMDPYWHPLTWLSWAIDYQIYGGLDSSGYHLTNNLLHAVNSFIVFILSLVLFGLNRTKSKPYPIRTDNHALVAAFCASLIFAVHPQHVESVAWVAERKDLLCQLFLMLSVLSYVKYASCHGAIRTYWFNGTLALFALALLSKPMAVTFPVVLLLLDVYPLRRYKLIKPVMDTIKQQSLYSLLREKLPFFLLSVLLVLITLLAHVNTVPSIALDLRILNAFNSVLLYLTKLLVPLNFAPLYPYLVETGEVITWKAFIPVIGVLGLTIASAYAWSKNRPEWLIAFLFYLVTLSPVLGLVQSGEQGAADRFAYWPTLPAYFLIGAGILIILDKAVFTRTVIVLVSVFFLIVLLTDKTRQQIQVWKDPHSLWSFAVQSNPSNVTAHYNLGITFFRQRDYENAAVHFDQSVRLPSNPTSAVMAYPTLAYRALTYLYLGSYDEALHDYISLGEALKSSPGLNLDRDCMYFNSGWVYAQLGFMVKASEYFGRVDPNSQFWPDTVLWLERINLDSDNTSNLDGLPSFCSEIFPLKEKSN